MLVIRVISALVAVAVLLPLAWVGGWWFGAFGLLVVGVCLSEFFRMTLPEDVPSQIAGIVVGMVFMALIMMGQVSGDRGLLILASITLGPTIWFLLRPGPIETVAARIGYSILGLQWIALLGGISTCLAFLEEGYGWLVLATGIAFGSDVGAFFVGRRFGRRKLYEKISPKKTWEGALGGIVGATVFAVVVWRLTGLSIEVIHLSYIAPLGSVLGQIGDLAQSMLKRSVGVKDSGAIMPGHGGLFDRIDALLFVAPPVFLYAQFALGFRVGWLEL